MVGARELPTDKVLELYDILDANVYIEEVRRPEFEQGLMDIQKTANTAGVDLHLPRYWPARGHYGNLDKPRPGVYISQDQSRYQQDLTFGHELGHHFLMRVCQIEEQFEGVEDFCEHFGLQLTLERPVTLRAGQLALL